MNIDLHSYTVLRGQRGGVLFVAIVLLLLASVVTLFALKVGAFEQRLSSNDVRSKLVQQVADAALTQGAEMILSNPAILTAGIGSTWIQCAADETAFPCGAIPAARRATMYRYSVGTTDVFGDGTVDAMDQRMLPFDRRVARVNDSTATSSDGFAVNYGVGAVMCRLAPSALSAAGPTCSTSNSSTISTYAVTLVAVANMGAEGARATAVKSFATNTTFSLSPDQPPIMASGSINISGTMQAVTSPNGGGPGVPVTIWSRDALPAAGTPDTCYPDEFFRSGTPTWHPNASAEFKVLRCDDCNCSVGQLTRQQGATCTGGRDILVNPAPTCSEANFAVQPAEFPCDLFQHVFGIQARSDQTSPADSFCETRITATDPTNSSAQIGIDELYLAEKADWIVSDTAGFGARFTSDSRLVSCADALTRSGLIWIRTTCDITGTVGSPASPVLIVKDNSAQINSNTVLFGLVFVRDARSGDLPVGGGATIQVNGSAAIYGGIIVQGPATNLNGTGAIIYDGTVMGRLASSLSNPDVFGLPGSWSDTVRY